MEPYTAAEKLAAERLGMEVEELRRILDVYLDAVRELAGIKRPK